MGAVDDSWPGVRVAVPQDEPRVTHDDPTNNDVADTPRVIPEPHPAEPWVIQSDPYPERKPSGEQAAAAPPDSADDDDDDEGLVDAIIAHALLGAGCSWAEWFTYPARDRNRLEAVVEQRISEGMDPDLVFALLREPATGLVKHWPRLLESRLRGPTKRLRAVV